MVDLPARLSAVCIALCCTFALAACGSTSDSTSTGAAAASGPSALVKFSACMRSHDVPDFPDPSTTETPNSFGIDGYNFDLPANLDPKSPAYRRAYNACANLIGNGGGSHQFNLAKARQAALAHAVCMRAHGVPNFADPTVTGGSHGITVGSSARGINPRSPAFQRAEKICAPS